KATADRVMKAQDIIHRLTRDFVAREPLTANYRPRILVNISIFFVLEVFSKISFRRHFVRNNPITQTIRRAALANDLERVQHFVIYRLRAAIGTHPIQKPSATKISGVPDARRVSCITRWWMQGAIPYQIVRRSKSPHLLVSFDLLHPTH